MLFLFRILTDIAVMAYAYATGQTSLAFIVALPLAAVVVFFALILLFQRFRLFVNSSDHE